MIAVCENHDAQNQTSVIQQLSQSERDKLFEDHKYLAYIIASKFNDEDCSSCDRDDVRQELLIELRALADRFDPDKGCKFVSFASQRLNNALKDIYRCMASDAGITRSTYKKMVLVKTEREKLAQSLKRWPTRYEISKATGLSEKEIQVINQTSWNSFKLYLNDERETDEDNPRALINTLGAHDINMTVVEQRDFLAKGLDRLDPRQKLVIYLHFFEGLTLKEISKIIKRSKPRASQILTQSLNIMRKALIIVYKKQPGEEKSEKSKAVFDLVNVLTRIKEQKEKNQSEPVPIIQARIGRKTSMGENLNEIPFLTNGQVKVAVAFLRRIPGKDVVVISQKVIAQTLSISESEVCKAVSCLVKNGYIVTTGRGGVKRGKTHQFTLSWKPGHLELSEGITLFNEKIYDFRGIVKELGLIKQEETTSSPAPKESVVKNKVAKYEIDKINESVALLGDYLSHLELERQQADINVVTARAMYLESKECYEKALGAQMMIIEKAKEVSLTIKNMAN